MVKKLQKMAAKKKAAPNGAFAALPAGLLDSQLAQSVRDSAQQIWAAGLGAFAKAQGEGGKVFEALVKEGMSIEQTTRKLATGKVDAVRDAVEDRVGVVRERAVDTWDRLENVFETRVQRALNRLGVPGREDLAELTKRVNELNAELRKLSKPAARPAKAAAKPARKPAAKKPAAKKPAARKPAKSPRKAALPKAPKPVAPQGE